MEEKVIYQGLTKSQIASFKKEESNCESHWDFLNFSEKLFEAEILNTVGSGKNMYDLNQHIWENRTRNI